jgi:AraC-like DNA-binding protein
MDYLELTPPPPLDRVVHRFWFLRGGGGPVGEPQTIVPDGRIEIVLHLGEPFAQLDDAGRPLPQHRVLLAGQLTSPLRLLPRPGADVVGIRLRTAAARRLFLVPQGDLTGRVVPLGNVARGLEARLLDAVGRTDEIRTRAARLAGALARIAVDRGSPSVEAAVAQLESGRPHTVPELAASVGLTPRTLQRRFRDAVGVDPTMLRRIFRFRTAFRLLEGLPPGRWSRVAARAGYFDQAHLIREFRRFAGAAPSMFFSAGPVGTRRRGSTDASCRSPRVWRSVMNVRMAAAVAVLGIVASGVVAQHRSAEPAGWLAGCWELRQGARHTLEMWMPPEGGLMLGASRTTVNGQVREFEQLRLERAGYTLVYTARPSGQTEASFRSVEIGDDHFTVANPQHDFPQRIGYRRQEADSLVAWIEGPGKDGVKRIEYPMRRVRCGG